MYGLPRAGILAKEFLKERLLQNDYFEVTHTPGLFRHKTRPAWFTLGVSSDVKGRILGALDVCGN